MSQEASDHSDSEDLISKTSLKEEKEAETVEQTGLKDVEDANGVRRGDFVETRDRRYKKKKKRSKRSAISVKERSNSKGAQEDVKEEPEKDINARRPGTADEPEDIDEQSKMIIDKLNTFAADPVNIENWTKLVLCQFYLFKLDEINTSDQTAHIDFGIQMWWKSEELVGKLGDDWEPEKNCKWWPDWEFSGEIKLRPFLPGHGSAWIHECFSEHGIMNNYQRWKGKIHIPLHLQEFPFDQQLITLRINSWAWGKNQLHMEDITPDHSRYLMTKALNHVIEWKPVEQISIRRVDIYDPGDDRDVSTLNVYIPLYRRSGFYLKNIISMGFLICLMGLSVCFDKQDDIGARLTITITLFLATVAFAFVTAEYLPKVSYGNYLSEFFMVMYSFLALEVAENVAVWLIVKYVGDGDAAKAPFAQTLDWIAIGVILGLQLIYFTRILYVATFRKLKTPDFDNKHHHGCCGRHRVYKPPPDRKWPAITDRGKATVDPEAHMAVTSAISDALKKR